MKFFGKHGQGGAAVAAVIIVIALFMVLYILLIPPEERQQLLDTEQTSSQKISSAAPEKIELLAESPGLLTPTTESAIIHSIPSVNIFMKIEPKITKLSDKLLVSKSIFSETSPRLRFATPDLDETKKVTLFFSVGKAEGELKIKVNGNTMFSDEIKSAGVQIIEIAGSFLRENNELEFSVSSGFLAKNKYELSDIGIKQEFERSNVEEIRTFTMASQEIQALTGVRLRYFQICNSPMQSEFTELDVLLNNRRVFSSEIRCVTTEEQIELDPNLLATGMNELVFRLEEGDFSFNQIKVETETREVDRPTYFFTLSGRQFDEIQSGAETITLQLLLEQRGSKQARFLINNNDLMMQTDKNIFERDLKDFVVQGTNFIRIIPVNSFNVVGLKVILE